MLESSIPIGFHGSASQYGWESLWLWGSFCCNVKVKGWGTSLRCRIHAQYTPWVGIHVCVSWSGPFSSCQGQTFSAGQGQMTVWTLMSDTSYSFSLKMMLKWAVGHVKIKYCDVTTSRYSCLFFPGNLTGRCVVCFCVAVPVVIVGLAFFLLSIFCWSAAQ